MLNLLKNLGDIVTATQALSIPKDWFGFEFNDGQVGLGGLLSAVITCYQLYPAKKWSRHFLSHKQVSFVYKSLYFNESY